METEGVTKYQLDFTPAPPLPLVDIAEINAWRTILHRLGLIGQDPLRYGGVGFGNISKRLLPYDAPARKRSFVVTGTQTGEWPELKPEHYTIVTEYHPDENRLSAEGPVPPSSEAMTHGTIYDADPAARAVIHVHSISIWRRAKELLIPTTRPFALYGTPDMAKEVERLFQEGQFRHIKVLAMGGHEDGVVSFGRTVEEAGFQLLRCLVEALQ